MGAVESLRKTAVVAGWKVVVNEADGTWQDKQRHSVLARFSRDADRAVAQWLDGKAVSAYRWQRVAGEKMYPERISFAELRRHLKEEAKWQH